MPVISPYFQVSVVTANEYSTHAHSDRRIDCEWS